MSFFNRLFTMPVSRGGKLGSKKARQGGRTVEPGILQIRALLQEETPRSLEYDVPEKRSDAFELWRDCVIIASVER
jgi:hypothetical protein